MEAWQQKICEEDWTAEERSALALGRCTIAEQADRDPAKSISFEEIDEGSTITRRLAAFLLVQEGLMQPDMDVGLRLTESGQCWADGIAALCINGVPQT